MVLLRAKVMLVVTRKRYSMFTGKKIEWLPDNHQRYNSPIKNGNSRGKLESCYVDINIVYTKGTSVNPIFDLEKFI
jgi:hypothetical protein